MISNAPKKFDRWIKSDHQQIAPVSRVFAVESFLKQQCQRGGFPRRSSFHVMLCLLFSSPTTKTHQKNSALSPLGYRTDYRLLMALGLRYPTDPYENT